jgi:hypothetical protein
LSQAPDFVDADRVNSSMLLETLLDDPVPPQQPRVLCGAPRAATLRA